MRIASLAMAMLLMCSMSQSAQAQERQPAKAAPALRPVALTLPAPRLDATRGRIAVCANLAAMHALDAKAVGADCTAQGRVADLAFLLCMSGPQVAG